MSTTLGAEQGVVRLVDEPDVIRKKFKTAVTDSGREVQHDPGAKPGISNLIEIMSVATGESFAEIESRYDGAGYGQFKEDVGEAVVQLPGPDSGALRRPAGGRRRAAPAARARSGKASEASAPTLETMYDRMGFVKASRTV